MSDQRPVWLGKELVWPDGRHFALEPVDERLLGPTGHLALIVHRGRTGLATVVHKGGLRALDVEWIAGEPRTAQIYLRRHQVKALVSDAPNVTGTADPAAIVGKPVTDGQPGPVIGKVVSAETRGDQVVATIEHDRPSRPSRMASMLMLTMLGSLPTPTRIDLEPKGEDR